MVIKNRLKEILDDRGIKYSWLAEQVGVTRQTMSNLINNRFTTSMEIAFKISKVLDINLIDIFYEDDE